MAFIQEEDKAEIREQIGDLTNDVKILVFTQDEDCQYCTDTAMIVEELSQLNDKISFEKYDIGVNNDIAARFGIKRTPGIVVMNGKDYGIRYYGIPAGYEFVSLMNAVKNVGTSSTELSSETIEKLSQIKSPVHIQVFVTPSCPYCPTAVVLSHQFAMVNDLITADAIEASEFPELALQYNVRGVPRIVVNETHHFEGALPEEWFADEVAKAVSENGV
ncbi:MAG: protein disulfide oxidoreductase [Candidatus Kryptoniota bacterium]